MTNTEQWEPDDLADGAIHEVSDVLHDAADLDVGFYEFAHAVVEALDAGKIDGYGRLPEAQ